MGLDFLLALVEDFVQEGVEDLVSLPAVDLLQVCEGREEVLGNLGDLLLLGFFLSALGVLHIAGEVLHHDLFDICRLNVDDGCRCWLGALRLRLLDRLLLYGPRLDRS